MYLRHDQKQVVVSPVLNCCPLSWLLKINSSFCCILVPPKSDHRPDFKQGPVKTSPSSDLKGPYLENANWEFTCEIRHVLPGKNNTSFEFYYNGNLRLQSKGVGQLVETDEDDHTKHVKWIFTTSFTRSDNGGNMLCQVMWKAGQYNKQHLKSALAKNVQITCK